MDGEFPVDFGDGFFHRKLQYKGRICDTNVIDVAREDMTLSTFVELVTLAGLEDLFLCAGPFTALIPNNDAFDALDPDFLASLRDPANQKMLEQLLLYHLLPGAFFSADFKDGPQVTLQGETSVQWCERFGARYYSLQWCYPCCRRSPRAAVIR
jgi:uncharacterized surface protein with fasciclin (FAS1) repeats